MPESIDEHSELPLDPDSPELAPSSRPLHLRPSAGLFVLLGGLVGTLARYGIGLLEPTTTGRWPWGTFLANLIGAFVLGALLEALARGGPDLGWRQRIRLLAGTGFCGGLTTYSTFATEVVLLVRAHHPPVAIGYLGATVVGGLLATIAGIAAAAGRSRIRQRGGAW